MSGGKGGGATIAGLPLRDVVVRFIFGAAISLLAGLVALAAGERVSGLLLAFPAILPAALTLIEKRDGISAAVSDVRGATVGALAMVLFAITVMSLATRIPTVLALLIAAGVWSLSGIGLYFFGRGAATAMHEQQYLPEVAAREAQPLVDALRAANKTIAVAESCTGGSLAAILTAVPKASDAVAGGVVAYTDDAKRILLGIADSVLEKNGAVSEACAVAMAESAQRCLRADVGAAVTGVIGTPLDGIEPGTMFVAATGPAGVRCRELHADGSPEACRAEAVRATLAVALEVLGERSG
jgi:nicotinamide-nucleotide amidase